MAQHGYLHDTYDSDDFGRGDDRERGWSDRDWRERGSGQSHGRWEEGRSDRGAMFGSGDDDRRGSRRHEEDDDRGFFGQVRSWFSDDDDDRRSNRSERSRGEQGMSHYGREHGFGGFQGDYGRGGRQQGGFGGQGDWSEGRRSYSAHPDDHYRSWRQKQIEALDRDYQEYCRECEQRFQQDFDSWRQNRQRQGAMGQGQSQQGGPSEEVMDLDNPAASQGGEIPGATTSAMGAGTLGTNNSENTASAPTATGRGRR